MTPARKAGRLVRIGAIREEDRSVVRAMLHRRWGPPGIVARGRIHPADTYPGYLARSEGRVVGLVTYRIDRDRCEVVSVDALRKGDGIGTRLLAAVERRARRIGCRECWLITTNDNLRALRFYQRRGWMLRRIYPDALARSRAMKPSIPRTGMHGIPLRDEIELFKPLRRSTRGIR